MKKDKKKKREKRLQKEKNIRNNRPTYKPISLTKKRNIIRIIPKEESVMTHFAKVVQEG